MVRQLGPRLQFNPQDVRHGQKTKKRITDSKFLSLNKNWNFMSHNPYPVYKVLHHLIWHCAIEPIKIIELLISTNTHQESDEFPESWWDLWVVKYSKQQQFRCMLIMMITYKRTTVRIRKEKWYSISLESIFSHMWVEKKGQIIGSSKKPKMGITFLQ